MNLLQRKQKQGTQLCPSNKIFTMLDYNNKCSISLNFTEYKTFLCQNFKSRKHHSLFWNVYQLYLPFQKHHQFAMWSVWKKINSHSFDRFKRFRVRHGFSPMTSKTSTAHISPSPVIPLTPFLSFVS